MKQARLKIKLISKAKTIKYAHAGNKILNYDIHAFHLIRNLDSCAHYSATSQ